MSSIFEGDRLLTERETAALIGVSIKTLQARRYLGQEPAFIRLSGKAVRYRWSDIEAWINASRVEPRNAAGAAE